MNFKRVSWDDLRIFLSVARTGNLSKAGRDLGIDHSTVGRRISALEYALGTPVFERDRMGFRLNNQGRDIFEHVEAIEASVMTLGDTLENGKLVPSGHVRIATMEGIASLYLSEQFVSFNRDQPNITIELVTSAHDVRVSQREADIFLGFFEPNGVNLDIHKIGKFSLHLYANADYISKHGKPASIADLEMHKFVGYIADLIQIDAVNWLDDAISNPAIAFHSNSMLSQMFAAAAGAGIVMLPAFARPTRFGLVEILPGQVNVSREVWLSTHRFLRHLPRIRAVIVFLTQLLQRDYPIPR
jgi:DNA-binding transcriptional LysR family regulator